MNISYRYTRFQDGHRIILRAVFALPRRADPAALRADMRRLLAERRAAQPLEYPSAGSAFRRVRDDLPTGALLDRLGLKGMRRGGAAVSEKHAGFIVNLGGARARDVRELISDIQTITEREAGVRLIPEIRTIPQVL